MKKRSMHNQLRSQQVTVEGIVTNRVGNQPADEDAIRSPIPTSSPPSIPLQHYVLKEERKKKKQMQQSQGSNNPADDSDSVQAGVIRVIAMGEASSVGVSSLSSITEAGTGVSTARSHAALAVVNAHVVDEEIPSLSASPIVEAMAIEESDPTDAHLLKALLRSRRCRIITALTFALFVGLVVTVVLLTQNSSMASASIATQNTPFENESSSFPSVEVPTPSGAPSTVSNPGNKPTPTNNQPPTPSPSPPAGPTPAPTNATRPSESPSAGPSSAFRTPAPSPSSSFSSTSRDKVLAKLKPLLSNESLSALDDPNSPQSLSLQWLFGRSNFQVWPFHRQVQRYAMATIYYATGGASWSNRQHWLTNVSECMWFQSSEGNFCNGNGTLLSLNQSDNGLNGIIPDEIQLLSSLRIIDLKSNILWGTAPSKLGSLTELTQLLLYGNSFNGTLPSELGLLTKLATLSFWRNKCMGTVPSELGALTALTWLDLHSNSFTGAVPSELGSLTLLTYLELSYNYLTGTLPSELGSLTSLTFLELSSNSLYGAVPSTLCNPEITVEIHIDCAPGPQCSCCTTCFF